MVDRLAKGDRPLLLTFLAIPLDLSSVALAEEDPGVPGVSRLCPLHC
jgi:hypothetical protein